MTGGELVGSLWPLIIDGRKGVLVEKDWWGQVSTLWPPHNSWSIRTDEGLVGSLRLLGGFEGWGAL
eukprot:1439004-Pyramimonas_sp.AAC.1